jgi:hypothetical protein
MNPRANANVKVMHAAALGLDASAVIGVGYETTALYAPEGVIRSAARHAA